MLLTVQFSLKLPSHKVGVEALVLDENKGPSLLYKSHHIRSFWVHLVYMAQ
jgi:hypothetical protein